MKVFTYSQARQNLAKLLLIAQDEEIEIRSKDGNLFSLTAKKTLMKSPFDIDGINTQATTQNILEAIKDSRMG